MPTASSWQVDKSPMKGNKLRGCSGTISVSNISQGLLSLDVLGTWGVLCGFKLTYMALEI